IPHVTRGGLDTAAVRMPDNAIALELIRAAGVPIAAPSANRSGRPSPTDAATVREDIGDAVLMVLDGGPTKVGL
ncbi:MAG TPA: threonylcarbamoyl-AMP synthase, partial [Synergistaceae bacterium]|nr:threonylcarbamoyl-AMP synthase [Synergistaceae bacterium]